MLRIPKTFTVCGIVVTVVNKPGMLADTKCIGRNVYKDQITYLDMECAPEETVEQALVHEMIHWILFIMNNDLVNDEKFVDLFAHLAYQILDSAVYDN
jgi:hypothetical protein